MKDDILRLGAANSAEELFGAWADIAQSYGAIMTSYHLTPAFNSQLGERTVVIHTDYPREWVELYANPDFRRHDPIPDYVMRTGEAISWRLAIASQTLTEEQQTFVKTMRGHGLNDGIALPLFGPNGREAYASMSIGRRIVPEDHLLIRMMVAIGQVAHRRAIMLIMRDYSHPVKLTRRETEVLQWMVRGKSNSEIGANLGISAATVDTFARRIYAKLNVNDRIKATLAGIARGLVRP